MEVKSEHILLLLLLVCFVHIIIRNCSCRIEGLEEVVVADTAAAIAAAVNTNRNNLLGSAVTDQNKQISLYNAAIEKNGKKKKDDSCKYTCECQTGLACFHTGWMTLFGDGPHCTPVENCSGGNCEGSPGSGKTPHIC
jgi:hypothetical protein